VKRRSTQCITLHLVASWRGKDQEHVATLMRVEESIEINRPPEYVFTYVSDVGNFPEWMAHTLEVRKDTPGPPQYGDKFTVAIKSVGRRFETPYERTSYEPTRRYTDRAVGGPIPNQRWECTFQEVAGGTRLMRVVDAEMGGILKLLEPLQRRTVKRQLRRDLKTLKDLLEAR
jgi:carbon monoxide dehydrogenase subunit G